MRNRYILPVVLLLCGLFSIQNLRAQNPTLFIEGVEIGCVGDCFRFFPILTGGPITGGVKWQWSVAGPNGFGFQSDAKDIEICPKVPGNYFMKVAVVFSDGTSVGAFKEFFVFAQVPLEILSSNTAPCNKKDSLISGSACEKVCPNTTVTYSLAQNAPNPGTLNYQWSVSGAKSFKYNNTGTGQTTRSVTVEWGGPGFGLVRIFSADSTSDCGGEAKFCVTIIEEPVAKISAAPAPGAGDIIKVCKGQTVQFGNQSTGADYYDWKFSDDGATSNKNNEQHTYNTPGIYEVTLIARSSCLCSDTTKLKVEVLDAESPTLDCVGTICPNTKVTYTASSGCPPYTWNITPNGTILKGGTSDSDSITVFWGSGPSGVITLGAQPCSGAACPLPANILVPIISDDAEIKGPERVCPGAEEQYYIEPFGGTDFQWTLSSGGAIKSGQGTNRVTVFWDNAANPGVEHNLKVKYNSCYLGCGGEDDLKVRVVSPFIIDGPVELCESAVGNYTSKLSLTSQNLPVDWTLYGPNGSVVWTSPAATANPAITFNAGSGLYRILAKPQVGALTCSPNADWTVNVPARPTKPNVILGENNICVGTAYSYDIGNANPQYNVRWTIQNGPGLPTASIGTPVNVVWLAAGPRKLTVEQISTDGLGCKSESTELTINAISAVTITGPTDVCEFAARAYTASSFKNVSYNWKIIPASAGTVAKGQGSANVEIFWTQPGGHGIELTVCGITTIIPVTVLATPVPVPVLPGPLCEGSAVPIGLTAGFSTYAWKEANGNVLGNGPTYNLSPGSYAIQVTTPQGCVGTKEFTIPSLPGPNVSISTADPTGFCNNSRFVSLSALVTTGGGITYQWFRDGNLVGGNTVTHVTNQYGQYTVVVTNAAGCTAQAGPILLFNDCSGGGGFPTPGGIPCLPGELAIGVDPITICDSIGFRPLPPGNAVPGSAEWIFGLSGGQIVATSKLDNPGIVFPNAGKYIVILKATLQNGKTCLVLDSVQVQAKANFGITPDCPGKSTNFRDVSTFLPGVNITNRLWDFGDPISGVNNNSSLQNPGHVYNNAGATYFAKLTITASNGCTSVATREVPIPVAPPANFAPPASVCAGNALEFKVTPAPSVTNLSWNFGDPASGVKNTAQGTTVFHAYTPGIYTVTAITSNAYGCTNTATQTVTIKPNTLTGNISPANPAPFCEGKTIAFTAPSGGVGASYLWSDNLGTTQSVMVGKEGVYRVTVTDAGGCIYVPPPVRAEVNAAPDAIIKALIENNLGQVIGTAYPNLTTCFGENVHMQVFGSGSNFSYQWSNGSFSNEVFYTEDRNNLLPVGTTFYTVTVTDFATGCTSVTSPFQVKVNPVPTGLSIISDKSCAGKPVAFTYTGTQQPTWKYIWSNGAQGTTMTTKDAGAYFVRVVNEFGCEAKSDPVDLLPGPNTNAIPGGCHSRCKPDSLCIPNIPNIVSWQWYKNGQPVVGANTQKFIAQESGTYHAVLKDIFGCENQSDPLTLNLYDGFGSVIGQVWADVNNNGIIDIADTLVSGIDVRILKNSIPLDTTKSSKTGGFSFNNILSTDYVVQIVTGTLANKWQIVIGQRNTKLVGCDAIVLTNLLVKYVCPSLSSNLTLKACPGGAATYNGQSVPTGTSKNFLLKNALGCDSVVTVNVQALLTSSKSITLRACPGSSATYDGQQILTGQSKNFTYKNYLNCDSIVTVSVQALPTSSNSITLKTCPGTTATYGGKQIAIGQTENFTLKNYLDCDSIVTVSVQALQTSSKAITLKTCPGTTITYEGKPLAVGQTENFTLKNYLNCDSIVTVSVQALPTSSKAITLKTCPGTTITYEGKPLAVGQTENFTLKNYLNCDSIVTVSVQALPTSSKAITLKTCPGTTATYGGKLIAIGQTENFTLKNYLNCDSIVTVSVQALPTSSTAITLKTCPGTTVTYEGKQIAIGQTESFILKNYLKCDSIVTVTVEDLPISTKAVTLKACPGQTISFNGNPMKGGDVKQFTYKNFKGCDSLVTVTVRAAKASASNLDVKICPGETYQYGTATLRIGDVKDFVLKNYEGCDSTVTVKIEGNPELKFDVQTIESCGNTATGEIKILNLTGGTVPFTYSIDGVQYQSDASFKQVKDGKYTVYIKDAKGCVFQQNANVVALDRLGVKLDNAVLACEADSVVLTPEITGLTNGLSYLWSNGATTANTYVKNAGKVWVELKNVCETVKKEIEVEWDVIASGKSFLYVPNVFAPDRSRDYPNDQFKPYFAEELELLSYKLEIFDRWGNLMFRTTDLNASWNGVFDAEKMDPGAYVWYLYADIGYCGRKIALKDKGDVTIVR